MKTNEMIILLKEIKQKILLGMTTATDADSIEMLIKEMKDKEMMLDSLGTPCIAVDQGELDTIASDRIINVYGGNGVINIYTNMDSESELRCRNEQ